MEKGINNQARRKQGHEIRRERERERDREGGSPRCNPKSAAVSKEIVNPAVSICRKLQIGTRRIASRH